MLHIEFYNAVHCMYMLYIYPVPKGPCIHSSYSIYIIVLKTYIYIGTLGPKFSYLFGYMDP